MKLLIQILIYIRLVAAAIAADIPGMELKPVGFHVVDPSGMPVQEAYVEASRHGPGNATGYTDSAGNLTLQLTRGASLHVYVSKNGYYNTGGELWTGGLYKGPDRQLVAREVPDSFTITLKRVINPVDLHHFKYRGIAPLSPQAVGFDLQKGDWIAPHGKGEIADILFQFQDIAIDADGYRGTMMLMFSNPGDGIQAFSAARPFSREFGSDLAPPNVAPVDGYAATHSQTVSHETGKPYSSSTDSKRNYMIRTRTRLDAAGIIRQACYGWIEGEFEFDPRDPRGPQVAFSCYFNANPDPDERSLEYRRHVPAKR